MSEQIGDEPQRSDLIELASSIVAAYVANHIVGPEELPRLIRTVHASLLALNGGAGTGIGTHRHAPAVPVEDSIGEDFLVCLEDGKKFKSLKRHLRAKYDMTPEQYREKWGLAPDYPMVAPGYSRTRSKLARQSGLGRS